MFQNDEAWLGYPALQRSGTTAHLRYAFSTLQFRCELPDSEFAIRLRPIVQSCVRANRAEEPRVGQGSMDMFTSNPAKNGAPAASSRRPAWRKAELPALLPSTTAEDALADIVLGCVDHLRGNEACVLQRSHEEGIHQMRVATRRLRSCLALYDHFIPRNSRAMSGELKWLIGELGPGARLGRFRLRQIRAGGPTARRRGPADQPERAR